MNNLTSIQFVSLGDAQQKSYFEQILVLPNEKRSLDQKVIIAWYFRFHLNIKLSREEIEQMNFEKYSSIIKIN